MLCISFCNFIFTTMDNSHQISNTVTSLFVLFPRSLRRTGIDRCTFKLTTKWQTEFVCYRTGIDCKTCEYQPLNEFTHKRGWGEGEGMQRELTQYSINTLPSLKPTLSKFLCAFTRLLKEHACGLSPGCTAHPSLTKLQHLHTSSL